MQPLMHHPSLKFLTNLYSPIHHWAYIVCMRGELSKSEIIFTKERNSTKIYPVLQSVIGAPNHLDQILRKDAFVHSIVTEPVRLCYVDDLERYGAAPTLFA